MLSYPVFRILCISYAPLLVMKSHHTLRVSHTLFGIYLAGFQGQTCWHLCFLHCFPYIIFTHMGALFCINIVATAHLFGILRTRIPTNLLYSRTPAIPDGSNFVDFIRDNRVSGTT